MTLAVSDLSAAAVSSEIIVPPGARSATFTISTSQLVADNTPMTISADYYGAGLTAEFTVGPPLPHADLEVLQTASPDPVGLGGSLTYTIDVTNEGPGGRHGCDAHRTLPTARMLSAATVAEIDVVPGPGLHVRFDYTYDTSGFFDTQEKKDVLQLAGDILLSAMGDDLAAIVPGGGNTWTAIFDNPATGRKSVLPTLVVPENEIIVYVGAGSGQYRDGRLEGVLAGPGGLIVPGNRRVRQAVATRGERGTDGPVSTDFGPWGGTITFNTNPAVSFSYDDDVDPDELDFFTVALHEMVHVLGWVRPRRGRPMWTPRKACSGPGFATRVRRRWRRAVGYRHARPLARGNHRIG